MKQDAPALTNPNPKMYTLLLVSEEENVSGGGILSSSSLTASSLEGDSPMLDGGIGGWGGDKIKDTSSMLI